MQEQACGTLWNLAANNANKETLMAAGAHVRILRAMDRSQDDVATDISSVEEQPG